MDARVRFTKAAIRDAFIHLLREKPLNKVTVTAICEIAQINRATFYKYYSDPFDLMSQIEAELILRMKQTVEQIDIDQITGLMRLVLAEIQKDYDIYMTLCSENGDSQLVNQIMLLCYQSLLPFLDKHFASLSPNEKEWVYYFMAQGVSGVIERWVAGGMRESPESLAEFINRLSDVLIMEFR